MATKLTGLVLDRVDLCPAGSNPDSKIMLFKSKKENDDMPQARKKTAKAPARTAKKADSRSKQKQRGDEEEDDEDDDAVSKSQDDEDDDELEDDENAELDDEDGEEEEKPRRRAKTAKTKKKVSTKKAGKKVAKAEDEDDEDDVDDDDNSEDEDDEDISKSEDDGDDEEEDEDDEEDLVDDKVLKALPAATRQLIEKQNERVRKARREAKRAMRMATDERDRRTTIEFVEKAKADYPHLPGTNEEKGAVLKAIFGARFEKAVLKTLTRMLKSGDKAIETSLMSESTGRRTFSSSEGGDSAYDQLCEKRDELMEDNDKLTKEQAMEKAIQANPALYKQYRVEKRRHERSVN